MKSVLSTLTTIVIISLTGCAPIGVYSTSTGHGSTSPFHREHSSTAETYTCMDVRDAQDDETTEEAFSLLSRVGLIEDEREVSVDYRLAATLLCEQEGRRGAEREIPAETCERWLAADGIPADVTGTVETTGRRHVDPRVADMMLPIVQSRLYLGLFMADAQRYCQDREMSTSLLAGGMPTSGFLAFAPIGASAAMSFFGGMGGFGGGLGFGSAVGTTGGGISLATVPARGDIVLNGYGMRVDAIALVTLNGVATPIAPGTRDLHLRPAVGTATTMWSVECSWNGVPMPHLRQAGAFGPDGGRLELDVICGRY